MTGTLLTRKQVAEIFSVKPRTIMFWERRGIITPTMFINGRPRYTLEEAQKVATEKQNVNFKPLAWRT